MNTTKHTCDNCQEHVSPTAYNCPSCGHTIAIRKSKAGAVILALFLGGLGLHRFYLGDVWAGIAFLALFVVSFIEPLAILVLALAALIDALQMLFRGQAYWRRVV